MRSLKTQRQRRRVRVVGAITVILVFGVSPITYVQAGLPPVLSIHGDGDPLVPYAQSVRLHKALTEARVPNELDTIYGGWHGQFKAIEIENAYQKIWAFLRVHGIMQ
jgi:acetyl esterase/lipase